MEMFKRGQGMPQFARNSFLQFHSAVLLCRCWLHKTTTETITNMPSIRYTLVALAISATAIALPRPQDPTDPVGEPLPNFPGAGISYIGSASGTITAYAYAPDGPAYGCLDVTGHVTKSSAACATFVATSIANSTYGSTIATSAGPCAFNPNAQYKFQCKDLGDVKPTSFYVSECYRRLEVDVNVFQQIGPWLAHGYYKTVSYEAWYNWKSDRVDEIVSTPSSGPVQYHALFKFQPTTV
jgi:hypothetical protein